MRRARGRLLALAAYLIAILAAGCGGGDDQRAARAGIAGIGEGGILAWGLAERPHELDPLHATSPAGSLISRQIHEPLAETVAAPFDELRRVSGLALTVLPARADTVWRAHLREGVRFQDGTAFNASAVLRNAERWQASSVGRRILPPFLVDAPRPDLVRFILTSPDPRFDARLASARLGIVSPRALRRAAVTGEVPTRNAGTGTGPFELRERTTDRLLLAHNPEWWGGERGLGPALDQLEFLVVPDESRRLAALRDGTLQVAALGPLGLMRAAADPLLAVADGRGGAGLAVERSVRGLDAEGSLPPMLNDVWLTAVRPG